MTASAYGNAVLYKPADIELYRDPRYYCAFPSVVRRPDGELLAAFRRAPDRRPYGGRCSHADPNAYLVLVRSQDDGRTWTREPELICAHPLGGSQDPCLALLPDGTLLCSSYLWIWPQASDATAVPSFSFAGGYLMRSRDGGHRWEGPILPPPVPGSTGRDAMGRPLPAYNRGNLLAARNGLLFWAVARRDDRPAEWPAPPVPDETGLRVIAGTWLEPASG